MFRSALIAAALGAATLLAHADPVVASYDTFSNFSGATFGSSGIPTDPAAVSTAKGITVALIATQRYFNDAPTHNGGGYLLCQGGRQ